MSEIEVNIKEEDENFSLTLNPGVQKKSPQHIKLKLPVAMPAALTNQQAQAPAPHYDLTDRDSVRQLLNTQKQHMRQLDSALGDALADFGPGDQDLVIDDKPIKLKLSLGGNPVNIKETSRMTKKKPLKTVVRQTARSKAMEDMNMTKVHQDDDYIYPSLGSLLLPYIS